MFKLAYEIIKDFGVLGISIVQFGFIIYLFNKLFTNHLHDLGSKMDNNIKETKGIKKDVQGLSERVSKIEGKISL